MLSVTKAQWEPRKKQQKKNKTKQNLWKCCLWARNKQEPVTRHKQVLPKSLKFHKGASLSPLVLDET